MNILKKNKDIGLVKLRFTLFILFYLGFCLEVMPQKPVLKVYYDWNQTYWSKTKKESINYLSNNNISSVLNESWNNSSKVYENEILLEITYNSTDNVEEKILKVWDKSLEKWNFFKKETYYYSKNLDSVIFEVYNLNWIVEEKLEVTYNSQEKVSMENYYQWDHISSKWNPSTKLMYTYLNDRVETKTLQNWNIITQNFADVSKSFYSYLINSDSIESTLEQRKLGLNWENTLLIENLYDLNLNKTTSVSRYYDKSDSSWNDYISYEFYVANNRRNQLLKKTKDLGSGQWEDDLKIEYKYSDNVGVKSDLFQDSKVKIYPNPVKQNSDLNFILPIKNETIYFYNNKGEYMFSFVNKDFKFSINLEGRLSIGSYMAVMKSTLETYKFLVTE